MPNSRSRPVADPFSSVMNGRNAASDHRIGSTVASATSVGNCSASDFGMSSPNSDLRGGQQNQHGDGRRGRGRARARGPTSAARYGASATATVPWPTAPRIRLDSVMPTCETAT